MMRIFSLRASSCVLKQLRHTGSSSSVVSQVDSSTVVDPDKEHVVEKEHFHDQKGSKLVTAAFQKLKTLSESVEISDSVGKMISEAKDTNELLSIVSFKKLTRNHALKLVSVLADWTVEGRVKTSDFEKDPRFVSVCKVLGSNPTQATDVKTTPASASTDLLTVLGVASDDEAAKLISNISLGQMIKVLSTLASKKRRSTPLLRSLAFNIASSHEKLDIKQGADALYAVASLNYHDEVLVDKICSDICTYLMENKRRAVVGSIITSLGLLRYKHIDLLDLLAEWVQTHKDVCAPQDFSSLVLTLAAVYHIPSNQDTLFPMVIQQLQEAGLPNPQEWLDLVWALTVLNKQTTEHVASVLSTEFSDKIRAINTDGLTVPTKMKLLNINGVAKLKLKDYKGPLLNLTSEEWKLPLLRSKDKQALVTSVQETMLNLLPSASYLGTNVDTKMGFMMDAECLLNAKLTPLPLFDKKTKAPIDRSSPESQRAIKVAVLVMDYHDMTRGRRDATGVNILCQELLRLSGFRVMAVDYIDFNPRNKLVSRVQYLNNQLKTAIGNS